MSKKKTKSPWLPITSEIPAPTNNRQVLNLWIDGLREDSPMQRNTYQTFNVSLLGYKLLDGEPIYDWDSHGLPLKQVAEYRPGSMYYISEVPPVPQASGDAGQDEA